MKIRSWEPEDRMEFKQEIHWIATTLGICPSRIRVDGSHPVGEDVIFIDNVYNGYLDSGFYDFMMLDYDPWNIYKEWVEIWRNKK